MSKENIFQNLGEIPSNYLFFEFHEKFKRLKLIRESLRSDSKNTMELEKNFDFLVGVPKIIETPRIFCKNSEKF